MIAFRGSGAELLLVSEVGREQALALLEAELPRRAARRLCH